MKRIVYPEIDMSSWLANLRQRSLTARQALLAAVMLAFYVLVSPAAVWLYGPLGLAAAGLAAGVCWLGAALALVIAEILRGPAFAFQAMLFALVFRTGIPLGFAVVVQSGGGLLTWAGLVYFLLLFYLVALGVEVILSLPETARTAANVPQNGVN